MATDAPSFLGYLRDYRKRSGFTMHLEHKVGEKLFVDFCGNRLSIVNEQTGEVRDVEVFVAILNRRVNDALP